MSCMYPTRANIRNGRHFKRSVTRSLDHPQPFRPHWSAVVAFCQVCYSIHERYTPHSQYSLAVLNTDWPLPHEKPSPCAPSCMFMLGHIEASLPSVRVPGTGSFRAKKNTGHFFLTFSTACGWSGRSFAATVVPASPTPSTKKNGSRQMTNAACK